MFEKDRSRNSIFNRKKTHLPNALVVVINRCIRLASLQPYWFLACTKHSYWASFTRSARRKFFSWWNSELLASPGIMMLVQSFPPAMFSPKPSFWNWKKKKYSNILERIRSAGKVFGKEKFCWLVRYDNVPTFKRIGLFLEEGGKVWCIYTQSAPLFWVTYYPVHEMGVLWFLIRNLSIFLIGYV